MTFSEKIRELRTEKKWTQEQAKEKIGISISALRNYENGRLPETDILRKFKEVYNVPYEYLLDDECENKSIENIDINDFLGLSDLAIRRIISIRSNINTFNNFISNNEFKRFITDIYHYNLVSEILYVDMYRFILICDLTKYIKKCVNSGKQDELKEYFDKCDESIKRISSIDIYMFLNYSNSLYDLFKESYIKFRDYIFCKEKFNNSEYNVLLDDLVDLIEEMNEVLSKECKVRLFEIDEKFKKIIDTSTKYNLDELYKKILGKYIKNAEV